MKDDKICARGERHGIIGILQVPSVQCSDDFRFEADSLAIADCSYPRMVESMASKEPVGLRFHSRRSRGNGGTASFVT